MTDKSRPLRYTHHIVGRATRKVANAFESERDTDIVLTEAPRTRRVVPAERPVAYAQFLREVSGPCSCARH